MLVQNQDRTANVIEKFNIKFSMFRQRFFYQEKIPPIYIGRENEKRDKKTYTNHSTNFLSFSFADFICLFTFRSDMFSNFAISFTDKYW